MKLQAHDPLSVESPLKMDAVLASFGKSMAHVVSYGVIALVCGVFPILVCLWALFVWLPAHGGGLSFRLTIFADWAAWQITPPYVVLFAILAFGCLACGGIAAAALEVQETGRVRLLRNIWRAFMRWPSMLVCLVLIITLMSLIWVVMRWPENSFFSVLFHSAGAILLGRILASFSLFIPICMQEPPSLLRGLGRSLILTKGFRGTAFLILLVFVVGTALLYALTRLFIPFETPVLVFLVMLGGIGWSVITALLYAHLCLIRTAAEEVKRSDCV